MSARGGEGRDVHASFARYAKEPEESVVSSGRSTVSETEVAPESEAATQLSRSSCAAVPLKVLKTARPPMNPEASPLG